MSEGNVVRVKHIPKDGKRDGSNYNSALNPQTLYAIRCFTEDGWDEVIIMARGLAIQRGLNLVCEVQEHIAQRLGLKID